MANRFPLIVDSSSLQIKELPANDNIDLANSGIVNVTSIGASSISVTGVVTATSFVGDGSGLTGVGGTANIVTNGILVNGIATATSAIVGTAVTINSSGLDVTGVVTATSAIVGTAVTINSSGLDVTGVVTATSFSGSGSGLTGISTNFVSAVGIQSGGVVIGAGITQLNFIGAGNTFAVNGTTVDISISGSSGGGAGGDGTQFNTGITTTVVSPVVGIGSTVLSFPSTAGKRYLVYSIFASNVASGNTESNVIGAFDFSSGFGGGQRSYFAYNIPIPTGTSIELLEKPQILNPSDSIVMRSTDYNRSGADNIIEAFITYEEKDSEDYFGVGVSTVGLGVTTPVGIFTSSTNPSVVESIRVVNRTDVGGYPISVNITSGVTTTRLVDNLIVAKYSSIELLDQPKRLNTNDIIKVEVDQASTLEVQVSGKQIT